LEIDTRFSPLETANEFTLVGVELRTGRSHQIRASLAFAGFPIIGDTKYGGRAVAGMTTQALHAWRLEIDGVVIQHRDELIDSVWGRIVRGET
jgi:23S rRNA-/tRNA-specific pseudouridylate synthase